MAIDISAAPDEPFPWDVEPSPLPERLQASFFLLPTTAIRTYDYPSDPPATDRVVGIHIGDLSMYVGISGGDEEIVAAADNLIAALIGLRDNATQRLAEAAR
jgi:hypothetical protein